MTTQELHPLVLVREHWGGQYSALTVFDPKFEVFGDDREGVLEELVLFLNHYLAKQPPDEVAKYLIPEEPQFGHLSLKVPREDAGRQGKIGALLEVERVSLPARRGGCWVVLPALGHVAYLTSDKLTAQDVHLGEEVRRVLAAKNLDGLEYLKLLPPVHSELERVTVSLSYPWQGGPGARAANKRERQRQHAAKLLAKIGRKLEPPRYPMPHLDLAGLAPLLEGDERTSVVLVGRSGTGKSALMRALVNQGRSFRERVFATSGAELVAGQSYVGQLEARVQEVMEAAELLDAVLYFESLDDLFAGRPGGGEDLASLMRQHVERGRVRIVGELTEEQYQRLQHRHVGLFSRLLRHSVEPLDKPRTSEVLRAQAAAAARRERPHLLGDAVEVLVDLVERYQPYSALPGKAVKFAEELMAARAAYPSEDGSLGLGAEDVLAAMSTKTGVPEFMLRDTRSMLIEQVQDTFSRALVGQQQAVLRVLETLCAVKSGLQPADKPLATFLFVGPTGVGKTELAKVLAKFLFGSEQRLVRFDMSEYSDVLAAERLIYGTDRDDGLLTRQLREQPFSVVLLDEIEKADSAVFDLLLQVCGGARLSDAQGRVAYFHNSIIIMTSNLGTEHSTSRVGFSDPHETVPEPYLARVREHFRPEFVNRLDRIVSFYHLTPEQIQTVCKLSVQKIARRRGFEERGIGLWLSPTALNLLGSRGYTKAYGARGLRRYLEQALVAPASSLLSGLGGAARGQLMVVLDSSESQVEALSAGLPELAQRAPLGTLDHFGLSFRVLPRASARVGQDVSGVLNISRMRRELRQWHQLPQILELRQRVTELDRQLNASLQQRRARARIGQGSISQLHSERARLAGRLADLDRGTREVDDIESLVVGALCDGGVAVVLEEEAEQAYQAAKQALVPALFELCDDDSIVLVIHELDRRRVLHELLLPLLEFVRQRQFEARIHVDRGERAPKDDWPSEAERRWGPGLSLATYLERYEMQRSFGSVLLRVRGKQAGALLSFLAGRFRYYRAAEYGELLVTVAGASFDVTESQWASEALSPSIDRNTARHAALVWVLADAALEPEKAAREGVCPVLGGDLFQFYELLIFDRVVAAASRGQGFMAGSEDLGAS